MSECLTTGFIAGTKILTKEGYKNIEKIQVGDMIFTDQSEYKPVVEINNSKNQDIYELKAQGSLPIECSIETEFYCKKSKNDKPQKIKLSDIKPGYYIGNFININSNNLYNLSNEDLWILGRYIADGHVRKAKRKNRKNSYQYQCILSIGSNKVDYLKENVTVRHYSCFPHSKSVHRIVFSSMELVNFILDNNFGQKALTKRIPQFIIDLPIENLKFFLDGYLSGDGSKVNT